MKVFAEPEWIKVFVSAYNAGIEAEKAAAGAERAKLQRRIAEIESHQSKLADALLDGTLPAKVVKEKSECLEGERRDAKDRLEGYAAALVAVPLDADEMAKKYALYVGFYKAVAAGPERQEAARALAAKAGLAAEFEEGVEGARAHIRRAVERVIIHPAQAGAEWSVEIEGLLAELTGAIDDRHEFQKWIERGGFGSKEPPPAGFQRFLDERGFNDGSGGGIRTPDTGIMIPLLWPTELLRPGPS